MMTSTQKSQNLVDGERSVENAFQRLDHQVHYADVINPVGQVGANWYVEWHSQATSTTRATCTQMKFDPVADTLLERSWFPDDTPAKAGTWALMAKSVRNDPTIAAQVPFVRQGLVPGMYAHQQLTVTIVDSPLVSSSKAKSETSNLSATFTALNSTKNSGIACQEVARS
jgi:hypothetical protein